MRTFRLPVLSSSRFLVAAILLAMLVVVTVAWALTVEQEAKLVASDGTQDDGFGTSVAVDGDMAVIGALYDDTVEDVGSAYVFAREGGVWSEVAKLLPASDGYPSYTFFGISVALDEDTALIGTANDDYGDDAGSVYVFTRTDDVWTEQAKLLPSDGAEGNFFGRCFAIDGDVAIIGAQGDDHNGHDAGSAYVFTRSGDVWVEEDKLLPADGSYCDNFGTAVAMDDDTVIIGTSKGCGDEDRYFTDVNSAHVFVRTGGDWIERAQLLASDGTPHDAFSTSIALDGDTAVLGALGESTNGDNAGAAYVFTRTDGVWTEQAKLLPADGEWRDYFGAGVAVQGDTAVIGAVGDDDNGDHAGAVYVFTRSAGVWTEQAKVLPDDGAAGDRFGRVAYQGDTAVIGAGSDDDNGDNSGSTYVFRLGNGGDGGDGGDGGVPAVGGFGALLTLLAVAGIGVYFLRRGSH